MSTIYCPVCIGSSQCFKCIIKQQKLRIKQLEDELAKYNEHVLAERLIIPNPTILMKIRQSNNPLSNYYIIDNQQLDSYKFITITFDPLKFGNQPLEQQRKEYILYQLYVLYKKEIIKNFYGSFEHHKNGLIHAHIICQTYNPPDVYSYLQSKFTDNNKNKYAIQMDKARIPNCITYINKESTSYFIKVKKSDFKKIIHQVVEEQSSESENPLDHISYNINNY